MKKIVALGLLAAMALAPRLLWADGMLWAGFSSGDIVGQASQTAWIDWDGENERLIIAVRPQKRKGPLAWLVPIPAKAEDVRLKLVDHLPDWQGEEVRAQARNVWLGLSSNYSLPLWPLLPYPMVDGLWFIQMVAQLFGLGDTSERAFNPVDIHINAHKELEGLVSEVASADSFDGLLRYAALKSLNLPAASRAPIEEHLRQGGSFVLSWIKSPLGREFAVEVSFPSQRGYYPMLLTSAYDKAHLSIEVRIKGWLEAVVPMKEGLSRPEIGYYGGPAGHFFYSILNRINPNSYVDKELKWIERYPKGLTYTRVAYSGPAFLIAGDWTFLPRRNWDLRLASWVGRIGRLACMFLLVLLSALASGMLVGWIAFPQWRSFSGLGSMGLLGFSQCRPWFGPPRMLSRILNLPRLPEDLQFQRPLMSEWPRRENWVDHALSCLEFVTTLALLWIFLAFLLQGAYLPRILLLLPLIMLVSLGCGMILGWCAYPQWRSAAGLRPLFRFSLSQFWPGLVSPHPKPREITRIIFNFLWVPHWPKRERWTVRSLPLVTCLMTIGCLALTGNLGPKLWPVDRAPESEADYMDPRPTPLIRSIRAGDVKGVKALLARGSDVEEYGDGGRPLQSAARIGNVEIIQALLDAGADMEVGAGLSELLVEASAGGKIEAVRFFLAKGADIAPKNWPGQTALMVASREGWSTVVEFLLDNGADIEAQWTWETPLIAASILGKTEVVKVLIARGAKIDFPGSDGGFTALMAAANYCQPAIVQILLEQGADLKIKAKDGSTALSRTGYRHCSEAARVLRAHGAKQ